MAPNVMLSLLVVAVSAPPRTRSPVEKALSMCQEPEAVLVPVVVRVRLASFVASTPSDESVIFPEPAEIVRL